MSSKHFAWLAAVTAIAAVLAFLVPRNTAHENGFEPDLLLPGLEKQVNEIDWLRISAEGETVATVRREADGWIVEEASAYRADWPQVQRLLSTLADARVIEAKTSNPRYFDRLGVEDPGSAGASGVLIAFAESTGLPAVISGNRAQGRDGQYARLQGATRSVLIDSELDLPRETVGWLDREIIDIPEGEVVEASVLHPDGESVVVKKISADDENFELQDVPDGFEPKSAWTVDALAGGLSALELDAVAPVNDLDWASETRYRVVTADGLDLVARLVEIPGAGEEADPAFWMRLEAGLYTTAIGSAGNSPETAQRAEAVNQRVRGWAYRIPQYRYDNMTRRMDHFLQEIETEE
ncbi:MAG: DUF4340 domain-containing protein [Lysobacterales bacterium]|jgi:hypothetical protein